MLRFSVTNHRKYPGYEVKAIITFSEAALKDKEYDEKVKKFRTKLEQMISATYKVKYLTHAEGIILSAKVKQASEAQSIHYKLPEYIRSAALALNYKIMG